MRNERKRPLDDEVDLLELLEGLWQRKVVILLATLVVTGAAVAYALLATPIYEAKLFVLPPAKNDVSLLNQGRGGDTGLDMFKSSDVFQVFARTLQSEALRRSFFRETYLPSLPEEMRRGGGDELYARFNKAMVVSQLSKEKADRFNVTAYTSDPKLSEQWVDLYVEMAGAKARAILVADARSDAEAVANNLDQSIQQARASVRKQREDEVARLTEALRVAKSIGLERPPIISNNLTAEVSSAMTGALTYMRGSKALEAEIGNLQSRSSDDPFVSNLRQRQEALAYYRELRIDPGAIGVYQKDGPTDVPDTPVKPRKVLIILGGLIAGLGLGVALVLAARLRASRVGSKAVA